MQYALFSMLFWFTELLFIPNPRTTWQPWRSKNRTATAQDSFRRLSTTGRADTPRLSVPNYTKTRHQHHTSTWLRFYHHSAVTSILIVVDRITCWPVTWPIDTFEQRNTLRQTRCHRTFSQHGAQAPAELVYGAITLKLPKVSTFTPINSETRLHRPSW